MIPVCPSVLLRIFTRAHSPRPTLGIGTMALVSLGPRVTEKDTLAMASPSASDSKLTVAVHTVATEASP